MKTKTVEKSEYDIQAEKFCKDTSIEIDKEYMGHTKRLYGQIAPTAEFKITISRINKSPMVFAYNDSVGESYWALDIKGWLLDRRQGRSTLSRKVMLGDCYSAASRLKGYKEVMAKGGGTIQEAVTITQRVPQLSDYDALSCLSYCYCGCFEDFCSDFGYDTDSRRDVDIWLAVQKESADLARLFNEKELELLHDIS